MWPIGAGPPDPSFSPSPLSPRPTHSPPPARAAPEGPAEDNPLATSDDVVSWRGRDGEVQRAPHPPLSFSLNLSSHVSPFARLSSQKRLVKDALASPDDLPDELAPLAAALAAAEARIAREAATREALEVEAQRVAELAVDARERAARAAKSADKASAAAVDAAAARDAAA